MKSEQASAIRGHYSKVKDTLATLAAHINVVAPTLTLPVFDQWAAQLRKVTGGLGGDALLNQLHRQLPSTIGSQTDRFLSAARKALELPGNMFRIKAALAVHEKLASNLDSILSQLARVKPVGVRKNNLSPNGDKKAKRRSMTTDDLAGLNKSLSGEQAQQMMMSPRGSGSRSGSSTFRSGIHAAVQKRDVEGLKKILAGPNAPQVINQLDPHGRSPLMNAVVLQNPQLIHTLLQNGANVDLQDRFGCTPLVVAASKKKFAICELLLKAGANPTLASGTYNALPVDYIYNCLPQKPLHYNVFLLMFKGGVDPNRKFKYGDTLLHRAATSKSQQYVQFLLEQPKVKVNELNKYGESALHKACRVGSETGVKLLLEKRADPSIEGTHGTPLELAARFPAVQRLINQALMRGSTQNMLRNRPQLRDADFRRRRMQDTIRRVTTVINEDAEGSGDGEQQFAMALQRLEQRALKSEYQSSSDLVADAGIVTKPKSAAYKVEPAKAVSAENATVETTFEPYRTYFFRKAHYNFACYSIFTVVSVLHTAKDGNHKALIVSPSGEVARDIPEAEVAGLKGKQLSDRMAVYVSKVLFPGENFVHMEDKTFQMEMLGLEASHSSNAAAFRLGIVYCKPGQSTEDAFFSNNEADAESDPQFGAFLDSIGDKIDLDGWSGFSGGFEELAPGKEQHSLYTSWRGLEIMFHVSTWMNADEQRSLLGNDLVLIYYQADETQRFQAVEFRGNVNCCAIVVRPSRQGFALGGFRRAHIQHYGPELPQKPVPTGQLKDFLLSKAVNGVLAAQKSPPLSDMISKVYKRDIQAMLDRQMPAKTRRSNTKGSRKNSRK